MCREFALYNGLGTFELELKEANAALAKEAAVLEILLFHSRRNSTNQDYVCLPRPEVKKSQIQTIIIKENMPFDVNSNVRGVVSSGAYGAIVP